MFNNYSFALLAACVVLFAQTNAETLPTLAENANKKEACPLNVCFALDGSDNIAEAEYSNQKFLTIKIVKALPKDEPVALSAVQYSIASTAISPSTPRRFEFIKSVRASELRGSTGTFGVAGINYCFSQLFRLLNNPACGMGTMVVMGDGRGEIGADPIMRARTFEQFGGELVIVGVGRNINFTMLTDIAGDSDNVFDGRTNITRLGRTIASRI